MTDVDSAHDLAAEPDAIRILIADDHPLYREGVVSTIAAAPGMLVVGEAADADGAVGLAAATRPDVALLDISMPGGGLEAARRIVDAAPDTRIVMLTVSEADDDVYAALSLGAAGFVLKGVGGAELLRALRDVASGGSYVSPALAARLLATRRLVRDARATADDVRELTMRETQILELIARGASNKEIGLALDLHEKTVKHHVTAILHKLGARNRVEAAAMARTHGGDTPPSGWSAHRH